MKAELAMICQSVAGMSADVAQPDGEFQFSPEFSETIPYAGGKIDVFTYSSSIDDADMLHIGVDVLGRASNGKKERLLFHDELKTGLRVVQDVLDPTGLEDAPADFMERGGMALGLIIAKLHRTVTATIRAGLRRGCKINTRFLRPALLRAADMIAKDALRIMATDLSQEDVLCVLNGDALLAALLLQHTGCRRREVLDLVAGNGQAAAMAVCHGIVDRRLELAAAGVAMPAQAVSRTSEMER